MEANFEVVYEQFIANILAACYCVVFCLCWRSGNNHTHILLGAAIFTIPPYVETYYMD